MRNFLGLNFHFTFLNMAWISCSLFKCSFKCSNGDRTQCKRQIADPFILMRDVKEEEEEEEEEGTEENAVHPCLMKRKEANEEGGMRSDRSRGCP